MVSGRMLGLHIRPWWGGRLQTGWVWWWRWWWTVSLLGNTSQLESCSAAHRAMVSTPTAAAATLDTAHHTSAQYPLYPGCPTLCFVSLNQVHSSERKLVVNTVSAALATKCLRFIVACRCRVHSTQGFHIDKIELWTLKARHLVNWVKCQRFDNKAIQWLQSKSVGWQNWICNSNPNSIWHCQPRAEISLSACAAKDQWHSGDLSLFLYSRICKKTDWWRGSVVKTTNKAFACWQKAKMHTADI